jgi:hypothetical protein
MLGYMVDDSQNEREELIPAPPLDGPRKERLAAILRGEEPGEKTVKGVSEQRALNAQRDKSERDSMKKSLRGPRKRG